jgi:hypothetical protein
MEIDVDGEPSSSEHYQTNPDPHIFETTHGAPEYSLERIELEDPPRANKPHRKSPRLSTNTALFIIIIASMVIAMVIDLVLIAPWKKREDRRVSVAVEEVESGIYPGYLRTL